MRFVWAVLAFVLATVLIGAGIAQRTVFIGPSTQQMKVEVEEPAPFVLMDGDVLRTNPGPQTLLVRGDGELFAAYGRTADLEAWLSDSDYNHVSVGKSGTLKVEAVAAGDADGGSDEETPAPTDAPATDAPAEGEAVAGRSPVGSDLWLDSFSDQDTLIADDMKLPDGISVLIARDGTADAPEDIAVSWPIDNATPLAGPLIAAGSVVLLAGLVMYVLAIRHQRRGRGPLRKGPGPLPVTEPIDIAALPPAERAAIEGETADGGEPASDDAAESGPAKDEKESAPRAEMAPAPARRRRMLAVPALALTALLASGCSSDLWPQFGSSTPTPSPTATVIAPENQKPPAVTDAQAQRILQSISGTVAEADTAMNADLAATRLEGAALDARLAEYKLRTALPETPAPVTIPIDDVEVLLPQATDIWPRTVLMVAKDKGADDVAPTILTMVQQDPWSNYKVNNIAALAADAVIPDLAAKWLGASWVPADSAFLSVAPNEIAAHFADVADAGEQSEFYGAFDEVALKLAKDNQDSRQRLVEKLAENKSSETSQTAFDMVASDKAPVALTTLESGAIVAVSVIDVQQVTPTNPDAVVRVLDNPQAKALTGVTESKSGFETKYLFQMFFAVPAQGSSEQIRLLGYQRSLLSEEVIK